MAYLSLYRKYRSQTFSALIGQQHVVKTLQNGLKSGKIAHAYLFTGPRGTGKTSTARLLAKALCCEKGPTSEPCNVCEACLSITNGSCMDVLEMDAASESGIDQVREAIVDAVEFMPSFCRYRIFILDEVHDLSGKAFDALLKTVEEPPEHVVLILATTEYNKVPPTIRSRCQKFEFHRASVQELIACLESAVAGEGVEAEPAALGAIARIADGGFRDALTLLEQLILTAEGQITLTQVYDQLGLIADDTADALLYALKSGDIPKIMDLMSEITRMGRDPRSILESLLYRLSDLTRSAYGASAEGIEATVEASLHETAARIGREVLILLRSEIAELHRTIRDITLPRVWLESELIRLSTELSGKPEVTVKAVAPVAALKAVAVQEARQEPPTKPEKPRPVPSINPSAAAFQNQWMQMLAALPENSAIARRLEGSVVTVANGEEISVQIPRKMNAEWMLEKAERQGFVVKTMRDLFGKDYRIRYEAGGQIREESEPEAVKLPAEGQRLHDMAREVLGSQ